MPTKYPAWHAGLRQSRGLFCLSAYVRRSIQRNKSLPAVAVSRPIPNKIPIAKQVKSGIIFCNSCKLLFFCIAHKCHHIKRLPHGTHCEEACGRLYQISTLLCFFERPGGFVEIIIPQFVQKEKRQTRKPAASMRFVRNRTQLRLWYHTSNILSMPFNR